jgi:hypothetical protein
MFLRVEFLDQACKVPLDPGGQDDEEEGQGKDARQTEDDGNQKGNDLGWQQGASKGIEKGALGRWPILRTVSLL